MAGRRRAASHPGRGSQIQESGSRGPAHRHQRRRGPVEPVPPCLADGRAARGGGGMAGSPAEGIEVIEPHLEVASLALVGHEPYLSELASILLTGRPTSLTMEMKKGGVAHLRLDDGLRRGTASLRWLVTPKVLRALSG